LEAAPQSDKPKRVDETRTKELPVKNGNTRSGKEQPGGLKNFSIRNSFARQGKESNSSERRKKMM